MAVQTRTARSNGTTAAKRRQALDPAEVAQVAYELFQHRGGRHGSDQQDWFEAERIVQQRQRRG